MGVSVEQKGMADSTCDTLPTPLAKHRVAMITNVLTPQKDRYSLFFKTRRATSLEREKEKKRERRNGAHVYQNHGVEFQMA